MTRAPDQNFLEFVRSQAAPLHRVAYLLYGDRHPADDLIQETLAKVLPALVPDPAGQQPGRLCAADADQRGTR